MDKISRQRGEGSRNDMGTAEEDSPKPGAVATLCCSFAPRGVKSFISVELGELE